MTTRTTTPARRESNVPSPRVLHLVNPFVSMILRSPFHWLISGQVLLLTFTGRKTGKQFTIPVNYTREGETLSLFTNHGWWKNLRGVAPVGVRLQGRQRTGHAEVITDRGEIATVVERLVAQYGARDTGRRVGLALDTQQPPSHSDLVAAMAGHAVVRLSMDT